MSEATTTGTAKLKLWQAIAISVGFMAPVLAMSLNGIGVAGLVGPSVPLVFLIAFAGVGTKTALRVFATNDAAQVMTQDLLVPFYREPGRPGTEIQRTTATAGDFLDFTFTFPDAWANNHFNLAGWIYGLVAITFGPRAGFFGGSALLGTYVFFAACTLASCGVFLEAFLVQLGFEAGPSWLIVALLAAVVVLALNIRESAAAANVLLLIGGVGIAAMRALAAVILGRVASGSAPRGQTLDLVATFTPATPRSAP
mgnify:CR=1 FL=1